jgi:photosystem II stability/assembly factor-like uncharacterized protein
MKHNLIYHKRQFRSALLSLTILLFLLVACGSNTIQFAPTPTAVPVNGFGSAANHLHAMLALPSHVLILATHYGLFRTEDDGTHWQEVAGGSGQLMDGLMTFSLTQSQLDPRRLYVLTLPVTNASRGTPGLYTSDDQGNTWKLSIPSASLTKSSIFLAGAGNETPDEVYIYLSELGALGLRISQDDGQHFSKTGTLPFGNIFGLRAIPGTTGHMLVYGSDGMALSTDGGIHWQVTKHITGGIYDMATSVAHGPIYASGDAGVYASLDGGQTFSLVNSQSSFASLTVSPLQPKVIYGKTGLGVYRSSDGGHIWQALPHIAGNLAVLAVDPVNASQIYLSLSYPTTVYRLGGTSETWVSLTPPV